MLVLSVDEQERALRRAASGDAPQWLAAGCAALAAGLLAAAVWHGRTALVVFALFAAAAAWALAQTGPHLRRAARALDAGSAHTGSATIEVTAWTDAPSYHAVVAAAEGPSWRYEFQPLGWTPVTGRYEAVLLQLPGIAWPALARIADGLLVPRSRPVAAAR